MPVVSPAFPANPELLDPVNEELKRLGLITREMANKGSAHNQHRLAGSGLPYTELNGFFGLDISNWLLRRFPDNVKLFAVDADDETIISILQLLLPGAEYEKITQGPEHGLARIRKMAGSKNPVYLWKWILGVFNNSHAEQAIKEDLFLRMKIFSSWKLDEAGFNRSQLGLTTDAVFFQEEMIRHPDSLKILKQPVSSLLPLSHPQKLKCLDTIRGSLSFLYRETDPFSFADLHELELFDMGRGLQIALVGMRKQKRLSLESYIGYMAFKNGVPLAYGGGWIWGQRCKIGINIYPAFRKGESAWQFAQIMRLYYQYCGVRHFIVKPYQFGKDNPEGLKSGAFWFYYRLGYRPADAEINEAAREEWEKIQADRTYRTPLTRLRFFTGSVMEWKTSKNSFPAFDAGVISKKITDMINTRFQGNRLEAISYCSSALKKNIPGKMKNKPVSSKRNAVWENWCLLAGLMDFGKTWKVSEKLDYAKLIQLKQTGKEVDFILKLQGSERLWKEIKVLNT
ncbi:MAG: hypothetical protein IPP93_03050 [Chitinophagaceae bacterium]|nr:hypothetical protein [Chitinophagaceae bacterium]